MKKIILLSLTTILVFGYVLGIRTLENFVLKEARKALPDFVSVKSVSINSLSSISLRDIRVVDVSSPSRNILSAKTIKIRFNPIVGIKEKDLSAITSIVLDKPVAKIYHYKDDSFNFIQVLDRINLPSGNNETLDIDIDVRIKNGTVEYIDERGFGAKPLSTAKVNKLYDINTVIRHKDGNTKIKNLSAKLNKERNKVFVSGEASSSDYWAKIKANGCELKDEINYFAPSDLLQFKNAEGDLEVVLKNNEVKKSSDLPISFNVDYKSKDSSLKLYVLTKDVFISNGRVVVNNDGVILERLNAQIEGQQFNIDGSVEAFSKLKININNSSTNMEKVEKFLPFLQSLRLRGTAKTNVNIFTNELGKVVITGNADNYVGTVIAYKLDRGTLSFTFADNKVDLVLPEVNAYKGVGRGYGYVEMKSGFPPFVSMVVDIRGIELYEYFKSEHFGGKIDFSLRIDSYTENLNGFVDIVGVKSKVFGQELLQARLFWQSEADRVVFADNSYAAVNNPDSVINFNGFLKKNNEFYVSIAPSQLEVNNFYFFYTNTGNYRAKTLVNGEISGAYDEQFKKDPVTRISGNLYGDVNLFELVTPQVTMQGKMEANFNNGLSVSVNVKNKKSFVGIKTRIENKKVKNLKIKASSIDLAVAKSFVRPIVMSYSGIVTCDVTIFPDKNSLFLKSQGVTGSVYLTKAQLASQNIDLFKGKIAIVSNNLTFNDARFINKGTDLSLSGEYRSTTDFAVSIESGFASSQGWVVFPKGIKGEINSLKGKVRNAKGRITFDLNADVQNVLYRGVFLPAAKGYFVMDNEKLSFRDVKISHLKDSYLADGSVFLTPKASGVNPFSISVNVISGELDNIFDLYNNIQINWRNKNDLIKKDAKGNISIFDKYNGLIKKQAKNLYSVKGSSVSQALDEIQGKEQLISTASAMPGIYGNLKGKLQVSYMDDFLFFSDLVLKDGRYNFISGKELRLVSALKGDYFDVSIKGTDIRLLSKDFDKLSLFAKYFPEKEQIEIVNFFAKIGEHKTGDMLKGWVDLKDAFKGKQNDKALDLYLLLDKDDIDVLTVFNKVLSRIRNQGSLLLHISGPFIKPRIDSEEATFRDFRVEFAQPFIIRTPFKIGHADLLIRDSKISFPKDMKVQWQGLDTSDKLNEFICNGDVTFSGFMEKFAGLWIDLDIRIKDNLLHLNIKDLFQGIVQIDDTSIKGRYAVAFHKDLIREQINDVLTEREKGPVLKTKVFAESGVYQIALGLGGSGAGGVSQFKPPLLLDVLLSLGKDIKVAQKSDDQDINRWFTNINIIFEERPELLKVQGSMNTIDTEGVFKFTDGRIIFMNKVFNLMDKQKQREIFGAGSAEIGENVVEVKMEQHSVFKERRKATPYFNIKTFSEVQKQVTVTGSAKYEDHLFVIFIKGPINDLNSFSIEHYKKGETGYTMAQARIYISSMTPEQMDTVISYLVPAVFRPDFYRSILEEGLADNQEANAMLREYSASQINLWIDQQLRPFEQEIAKNMGLYDVSIKHDLGSELVNAMQVFQQREDRTYNDGKDNSLSVEYVKDLFFKKFFVKVKTGISQDPTKPLLNMSQYELAWFLNDYLSLNYGNYNLNQIDTMYGAFSVNANFVF